MEPDRTAHLEKKSEFIGKGCLIQGLGLLMPFFFGAALGPIGIVFGVVLAVVLLLAGSAQSTRWQCSLCTTRVNSKRATVCPGCRASLC